MLECELLALFETQCARLRPLIQDASPPLPRADAVHTLKGSARAIGAWRLASAADLLETKLRNGEAAESLMAPFEEAVEATLRAIAERGVSAA